MNTTHLLLVALFVFSMLLMSANHGRRRKKVLFLGDEVNDMDAQPGGFISWVIQTIRNEGLEERYKVAHAVKPGEKIYDLYMRLDSNVLMKDINIAVLHIGLHDVADKYMKGTGTDLDTFNHILQSIVTKLQAAHIKVMVCIPNPALHPGFNDTMTNEFADYADLLKDVCHFFQIPCADLNSVFEPSLATGNDDVTPFNVQRAIGATIWKVLKTIR